MRALAEAAAAEAPERGLGTARRTAKPAIRAESSASSRASAAGGRERRRDSRRGPRDRRRSPSLQVHVERRVPASPRVRARWPPLRRARDRDRACAAEEAVVGRVEPERKHQRGQECGGNEPGAGTAAACRERADLQRACGSEPDESRAPQQREAAAPLDPALPEPYRASDRRDRLRGAHRRAADAGDIARRPQSSAAQPECPRTTVAHPSPCLHRIPDDRSPTKWKLTFRLTSRW